jgi:hypothetical protein
MCPKCNVIINSKSLKSFNIGKSRNIPCGKCRENKNLVLERNCPKCNDLIKYNSQGMFYSDIKHSTLCKKCKPLIPSVLYTKVCCNCCIEVNYLTEKYYKKLKNSDVLCTTCRLKKWHNNKNHTSREKILNTPRFCPNCNKELSRYNTKNRIRLCKSCAGLQRITPYYNPNACKIIDEYGKANGYNFRHAENGGEYKVLRYSLDGYDKEKNVVIEYDEKHHFSDGYLVDKDVRRMNDIICHLKCKFLRLNERGEIYMVKDYNIIS